jgi:hypothetical protein
MSFGWIGSGLVFGAHVKVKLSKASGSATLTLKEVVGFIHRHSGNQWPLSRASSFI